MHHNIYIYSAIGALREGGLLCITCTDTSNLCGNNKESCFRKYGGLSIQKS